MAHHEHIIWGIPIVGQTTGGIARRVSLGAIHKNLLELSSTIEPDLETWIISNSSVNQVITQNPLGTTASLLI